MSRSLTILFSLVFITISFHLSAQRTVENLEKIIQSNKNDTNEVIARNDLFRLLFRTDMKEARSHIDEGMKLARKLDYKRGIATCYHRYCIVYYSYGNYDHALKMIEKAKGFYSEIDDEVGLNLCRNMNANIQLNLGNFDKALESYFESEKYHKKGNDLDKLGTAKHNIFLVYSELGDYRRARKYIEESLEIYKQLSDSAGIMTGYNGIGTILSHQQKHKEAIEVYHDALVLANSLEDFYEKGLICNNIGAQYSSLNELDSTRFYYLKALASYKSLNLNNEIASLYANLGRLEEMLKNGERSKKYYDSCLVLARELKIPPTIARAYLGLSASNSLLNNDTEALKWYKKYHDLNDSLTGERVKNNINELQVKYDAGKKNLRIASLEKSRLEANIKKENNGRLIIIIILSSLILITLLFLILSRKNTLAKQRMSKLEQKVLRVQMNPHFIFNSLNSIQSMYVDGNEDRANDYVADFSSLLRGILVNSGKSDITLRDELELTENYLELEKIRTNDLFEYHIDLEDEVDPLLIKVPPLIFQPYIENAIWHGIIPKNEKGNVRLSIRRISKDDCLICQITDNGVGFNQAENQKNPEGKTSQGMIVTAERLGGEENVKIDTVEDGGTRVTIRIPYKL